MDAEDLKMLALRLAALAERLDERSEAAGLRVERAADALEGASRQLAGGADDFQRQVAQALRQQAGESVGAGLTDAMQRFERQVDAASRTASTAASGLDAQRRALQLAARGWLWIGGGALLAGSSLAFAGALYAIVDSRRQVEGNRVEAALLRAYNRADVTLCGDTLCANVDDAGVRHGARRQYRPVRDRGAP